MIKLENILRRKLVKESRIVEADSFKGKDIISVDIQQEYQSYFTFKPSDWGRFLTKNWEGNNIVFLYNGESMGMTDEGGYKDWLLNYIDYELLEDATYYDKGYAYFRFCMDEGIDDRLTVDLIRFMVEKNVTDSRDLNKEMWDEFMASNPRADKQSIRDLIEVADDMVWVPEVMEELKQYNNPVVMGGGINECLKEVELALMALNKPYTIYKKFTY
jgi:hypothetical protein